MTRYVLLPGLDGTGDLFGPFAAAAPADADLRILSLPLTPLASYDELLEWALPLLPQEPCVLVAESFSGPLGILLAARAANVRALAVCASFCRAPLPSFLRHTPRLVWRRPPPVAVVQLLLTGGDYGLAKALQRSIATVPADVIAARVQATLTVDVRAQLSKVERPLLYLRGSKDRVVSSSCGELFEAVQPRTRLIDLSAPHLVLQTQPRQAWQHIAQL